MRLRAVALLAVAASACATGKRPAESAPSTGGAAAEDAAGKAQDPAPPPQPARTPESTTTVQPAAPSAYGAPSGSRAAALAQASGEIESAQRELDVAAGDCRNACRALRSMDRATGHLCALAASGDETRRCADAKTRLVTARDKVRSTCGTCPDGPSLDRNAPIPSP